jgi:hypothetical protein
VEEYIRERDGDDEEEEKQDWSCWFDVKTGRKVPHTWEERVAGCVKIREDGLGCICAVCFGKNVGMWDGKCYWVGVGEQKPANHPYP